MNNDCRRLFILLIGLIVILLVWADLAVAHSRSTSSSQWHINGTEITVNFSIKAYEVTRLPLLPSVNGSTDLESLLREHLQAQLQVSVADTACVPRTAPIPQVAQQGYLRMAWHYDCPVSVKPNSRVTISNGALFEVMSAHVHFAKVQQGEQVKEFIFTDRKTIQQFSAAAPAKSLATFVAYVQLGMEHILIGIDHLAFVLGLLLICRRLKDVIWLVGGFTLGHSVTLSLVALGYLVVDIGIVEALIGFSIAMVAVEGLGRNNANKGIVQYFIAALLLSAAIPLGVSAVNSTLSSSITLVLWLGLLCFVWGYLNLTRQAPIGPKIRSLITVVFGLVHGFGFAAALADFDLTGDKLIAGLLGFNIGVELGQVAVVTVAWITASICMGQRLGPYVKHGHFLISASLFGLGMFWFIGRSIEFVSV